MTKEQIDTAIVKYNLIEQNQMNEHVTLEKNECIAGVNLGLDDGGDVTSIKFIIAMY